MISRRYCLWKFGEQIYGHLSIVFWFFSLIHGKMAPWLFFFSPNTHCLMKFAPERAVKLLIQFTNVIDELTFERGFHFLLLLCSFISFLQIFFGLLEESNIEDERSEIKKRERNQDTRSRKKKSNNRGETNWNERRATWIEEPKKEGRHVLSSNELLMQPKYHFSCDFKCWVKFYLAYEKGHLNKFYIIHFVEQFSI